MTPTNTLPSVYEHIIGSEGESLAGRYLRTLGHTLLRRNYRSPYGEIDLVTLFRDQVHFTEVKVRRDTRYGGLTESVPSAKQIRLQKTIIYFLTDHDWHGPYMVDLIGILLTPIPTLEYVSGIELAAEERDYE